MREIYIPNNPKMLSSAVCFIDILGFSSLIEESCKNHRGDQLLSRLYRCIIDNISFIRPSTQYSGKIKFFTDNIVIGIPILDDGESRSNIFRICIVPTFINS